MYKFSLLLVFVSVSLFAPVIVNAQLFSGSDITNYRCPNGPLGQTIIPQERGEIYVCDYGNNVVTQAIPEPPSLRELQFWLVRVIYILWAVSGIVFTGALIWIGFKYITSFGNEYAVGGVIKDFRKFLIAFALVFLSYPALNLFFQILPISSTTCYSQDIGIGFQFFFSEICTGQSQPGPTIP